MRVGRRETLQPSKTLKAVSEKSARKEGSSKKINNLAFEEFRIFGFCDFGFRNGEGEVLAALRGLEHAGDFVDRILSAENTVDVSEVLVDGLGETVGIELVVIHDEDLLARPGFAVELILCGLRLLVAELLGSLLNFCAEIALHLRELGRIYGPILFAGGWMTELVLQLAVLILVELVAKLVWSVNGGLLVLRGHQLGQVVFLNAAGARVIGGNNVFVLRVLVGLFHAILFEAGVVIVFLLIAVVAVGVLVVDLRVLVLFLRLVFIFFISELGFRDQNIFGAVILIQDQLIFNFKAEAAPLSEL